MSTRTDNRVLETLLIHDVSVERSHGNTVGRSVDTTARCAAGAAFRGSAERSIQGLAKDGPARGTHQGGGEAVNALARMTWYCDQCRADVAGPLHTDAEIRRHLARWFVHDWCHIRRPPGAPPLCGAPPPPEDLPAHDDTGDGPYCTGCGRRNCPDCELLWREGKR